jgi:thiosulfate dehydrogenase
MKRVRDGLLSVLTIITLSGAPAWASERPSGEELPATAGLPPPPELKGLPEGQAGELVRYGMELLANTAEWIGPRGKLKPFARKARSRMACRNCHLDVGQRPFGNSWLDTQGLYPQYRSREGEVQTLAERVNACIQHPLQGPALPENGREMKAILSYYKWIARGRPNLETDPDTRLFKLAYLSRAADPQKGAEIFKVRCAHCHGESGQGKLRADETAYVFPPLWGKESFMIGSSMSRTSLLARFIKANMPLGAIADRPLLSDEDAWDVAAFVNSQPHPPWAGKALFPSLSEKPFDFPAGPYADPFPLEQHRLGPFQPIIDYWKARNHSSATDSMGI